MARFESQAKAGFYPTPLTVVDRIAGLLVPPPSTGDITVRLLDPCCGEGEALARLGGLLKEQIPSLPLESYGVELHRGRRDEALEVLDHVLCSDLFRVSAANSAFQLLFLNPPYDYDDEQQRLEHKFLMHTTRYLAPGGVLVFIVPQGRLAVSARYLSSHYERLSVYRFPDPEYDAFRQVVLFGVRKAEPSPAELIEAHVRSWSAMELPELPTDASPIHAVPAGNPGSVLFGTRAFDPEAAVGEAARSGLWANAALRDRLWPADTFTARPLMPLRKGHLAMLIAAGLLNNLCLEADGARILVKGRAYKEFVLTETSEESETHREVLRTSVVALDLASGEIMDIQA